MMDRCLCCLSLFLCHRFEHERGKAAFVWSPPKIFVLEGAPNVRLRICVECSTTGYDNAFLRTCHARYAREPAKLSSICIHPSDDDDNEATEERGEHKAQASADGKGTKSLKRESYSTAG